MQKRHSQTQTEWEKIMAEKILSQIKSELYLDFPFLSRALSALQGEGKENLTTFATDGRHAFISPEQTIRLYPQNPVFLNRTYLHMVLHCLFFHLWTKGERETKVWGLACDIEAEYAIDCMSRESGFRKSIARILNLTRQETYRSLKEDLPGITAPNIYVWLSDLEEERLHFLAREFYGDDHRYWPGETKDKSPAPGADSLQKEWETIARQSLQQRGRNSSRGEEVYTAMVTAHKRKRNLSKFLRLFSVTREEVRPDPEEFDLGFYAYGLRLYKDMPLLEPLETREAKKIREFAVVIDTSDSTSGDLVRSFLNETYGILSMEDSFFKETRIRILLCDDKVRRDFSVTSGEEMDRLLSSFTLIGGGGTDFRPAFSYVEGLKQAGKMKNLSGLIYFTDGKGIYPKKRPSFKSAFLFLGDYDRTKLPPWAMSLRLDYGDLKKG